MVIATNSFPTVGKETERGPQQGEQSSRNPQRGPGRKEPAFWSGPTSRRYQSQI